MTPPMPGLGIPRLADKRLLQNIGSRDEIEEGEDRSRRNITYISRTSSRNPTLSSAGSRSFAMVSIRFTWKTKGVRSLDLTP
jgi:hypothetical protein